MTCTFRVVGLYAPSIPTACKSFFKEMQKYFMDDMLLLGDFNSVTSEMDCLSGSLDPTSADLHLLLDHWSLTEPCDTHLNTFSYHHPSVSMRKSHTDQIYMNKNWNNVRGYASPTSFSDHYIIGIYTQRTGTLEISIRHVVW